MLDFFENCVRDNTNCVREKNFWLIMDDKEKEKFGVIVDKNNQSEGEQPKIEENTTDGKSDLQKSDEQSSVSTDLQPKVDDNKPNEQKQRLN